MNDEQNNNQSDNPAFPSNTQQIDSCSICGQQPCICVIQDVDTSSHNQLETADKSVDKKDERKIPKVRWI